jgi:hypothetical protein
MKAVWPDSFVEEANLSQNIFRIRKALGGASGDERYIVTLPGRGYRFTARVREVVLDGEDLIIGTRSRTQMVVERTDLAPNETNAIPDKVPDTSSDTFLPGPRRKSIWKYALAIAAVVAAVYVYSIRKSSAPIASQAEWIFSRWFADRIYGSCFGVEHLGRPGTGRRIPTDAGQRRGPDLDRRKDHSFL